MSGPPQPPNPSDDPVSSPRIFRTNSSSSVTPTTHWPEHHLSTSSSYFPPGSPVIHPISPSAPHRLLSSSRFQRSNAARGPPNRSTSVASSNLTSRPRQSDMLSEAEEDYFQDGIPSDDENVETGPIMARGRGDSRARDSIKRGKQVDEDGPPGGEDSPVVGREYYEDDPVTVKERQSLINVQHPFGLPIWKPALYKKSRTVTRNAENELHAQPSAVIEGHYLPGNILWTIIFGWWLAAIFFLLACVFWLLPWGGRQYAELIYGLGWYIFWPFGKYVQGDEPDDEEKHGELEGDGVSDIEHEPDVVSANLASGSSSAGTVRGVRQAGMPQHDSHLHPQFFARPTSWETQNSQDETTPLVADGVAPLAGKSYGSLPLSNHGPIQAVADAKRHWLGTVCFWLALITIIAPLMLIICLICWALVVTIPMAKLTWALIEHLFSRPNRIRFCAAPVAVAIPSPSSTPHSDTAENGFTGTSAGLEPVTTNESTFTVKRAPRLQPGQSAPHGSPRSKVLLCTYRAMGLQYYKYTVGGVNILFINLLPIVFFTIFDGFVLLPLLERMEHQGKPIPPLLALIASQALLFILSLASVIPLSYFIGMAVASISAQSSIGMGAVINATFGSIIEIILYGIALTQGKGRLVEGSIVGSILAGVLLMPGASMCSGALRQKEQKFNAKSAGVTSTMLIMAIIGVLTPTMFYQTYSNFELICTGCPTNGTSVNPADSWKCTHCYYEHPDPVDDPFYQGTVKTLSYFCAGILLFSYLIGLWFSLRTHASQIWQNPRQLMNPLDLSHLPQSATGTGRMSLYNRIVASHLAQSIPQQADKLLRKASNLTITGSISGAPRGSVYPVSGPPSPSLVRRISYAPASHPNHTHQQLGPSAAAGHQPVAPNPPSLSNSGTLPQPDGGVHHMVKDSPYPHSLHMTPDELHQAIAETVASLRQREASAGAGGHGGHGGDGGHDAPSWSRLTSASVLLGCTALYAIIAEILVDVVDVVLKGSGIDEKFLGITLFALVPNTTEFMNAMSFALNGNIALSMEIGSAYALQVCLLQIPAMVAFSAWYAPREIGSIADTFTLIFPRWDVIAIILAIFLLTYTYIEAKSNYHRGSILILSYVVLTAGFYFAPPQFEDDTLRMWSLDALGSTGLNQLGFLQSLRAHFHSLWSR